MFTYFIQAESGGLIKIGAAKDVVSRLMGLQVGSPVRLKVLTYCDVVEYPEMAERKLHIRFSRVRRHGEWFEPIPDLVHLISDLASKFDTSVTKLPLSRSGCYAHLDENRRRGRKGVW